jgi:hypothetical protein
MSKKEQGEYLEKRKEKKSEVEEQMLYGNDETISEKKKKQGEYEEKTLNE